MPEPSVRDRSAFPPPFLGTAPFIAAIVVAATACAPSVPRVAVSEEPDAGAAGVGGAPAVVHDAARVPPPDAADASAVDRSAPDVAATDAAGDGRSLDARPDADAADARDATVDRAGDVASTPDAAREAGAGGATGAGGASGDAGSDGAVGNAETTDGGDAGGDDGEAAVDVDMGPPAVEPQAGDVVIDELLVNPAGSDTNREWIEIANTTSLTLDLRALHVADSAKDVAVDAGWLAPGALLVLGQSTDAVKNGGAAVALAYGGTISLNNDGDAIAICLGPCATGLILDRVAWTADLGAAYDGHAAIVTRGGIIACPAADPFGTAGSCGTPGAPNPPCPPPDAAAADAASSDGPIRDAGAD